MFKIIGADGKEYGPIPADQIRQWIGEGRVNSQTQALAENSTGWKPLREFPEFSSAFAGISSSPIAPGSISPTEFPKTNPLALTGMILGIISLTFGLCCCYGLPFNIAGIIFSSIGLVQVRKTPERYTGKGMAIAGLVTSILSILVAAALLILGFALGWDQIMRDLKKL